MYKRKTPIELNCGLDLVREVLNGKWKIHLLYFISEGAKRPRDLQRKIPRATRRVLNVQLSELEKHGLISRTIYAELPPRVEYELTALGQTVLPLNVLTERVTRNRNESKEVSAAYHKSRRYTRQIVQLKF